MDNAAKEARKAYHRAWRKAHKDKVRQYNEAYWARKAGAAASEATGACKPANNMPDACDQPEERAI